LQAGNHAALVICWALQLINAEVDAKRLQPALFAVFTGDCVNLRAAVQKMRSLVENPARYFFFLKTTPFI